MNSKTRYMLVVGVFDLGFYFCFFFFLKLLCTYTTNAWFEEWSKRDWHRLSKLGQKVTMDMMYLME